MKTQKEYLIKDTGTSLDDMLVLCSEENVTIFNSKGECYDECKTVEMFLDTEEDVSAQGVYVSVVNLIPVFRNEEAKNPSGDYLKGFSFETPSLRLNVLEFEEVAQVSVLKISNRYSHVFTPEDDKVLYSDYKSKNSVSLIKKLFELAVDGHLDEYSLLKQLKELD